jgi:hypothetical protein
LGKGHTTAGPEFEMPIQGVDVLTENGAGSAIPPVTATRGPVPDGYVRSIVSGKTVNSPPRGSIRMSAAERKP